MAGHGCSHLPLLLAIIFFLNSTPHTCNGARDTPNEQTTTSIEFIRASCKDTQYPNLCFTSLSTHASTIHTSRTQLIDAALCVTLTTARATSAAMKEMNPPPSSKGSKKDCMEEVSDSVDELRESLAEMEHLGGKREERGFRLNDIQTWVSAALTDEDTCMDELKGVDGAMKSSFRARVVEVVRMTCNALDLVNRLVMSSSSPSP